MDPFTVAAGAASTISIVAIVWFRHRAARSQAEGSGRREEVQPDTRPANPVARLEIPASQPKQPAAQRQTLAPRPQKPAAQYDPLTGLLNRHTFYRLATALLANPPARPLVAVLANMDDFTSVNTAYGHRVGDQLLSSFAGRFADYIKGELVGRVAGDEFAAVLPCSAAPGAGVYPDARSLSSILTTPIWAEGQHHRVTASVGLAMVTVPDDLDDVLRRAAVAMRSAKAQSRNRPFPPAMTIHGKSFRCPAPCRVKAHTLPRRGRRRVRSFRVRLSAGKI